MCLIHNQYYQVWKIILPFELLNKRPRKKLNYNTPEQVFFINLELEKQKLALDSDTFLKY